MNSPCLFCTFSTSPESLNQEISSPYSPWAYSSCAGRRASTAWTAPRDVPRSASPRIGSGRRSPPRRPTSWRGACGWVRGRASCACARRVTAGGSLGKPRGRFSRQAPWYSRSIATNSLRDGCPHAVVPTETTSSHPEAPPSHARRRRTPPSAAAPRPSFRPWTPWWAAWLFAAASAQTASLLGRVLVGGAGEVVVLGWSHGGVLGTARFRLCAPWLPFLCLAARAPRPRAVAL